MNATAQWLAQVDPLTLLCRDTGHMWRPHTAARTPTGFVRTLGCARCDTTKTQQLDRQGGLTKTTYRHAPGYLTPRGVQAPAKQELRLDGISHQLAMRKE